MKNFSQFINENISKWKQNWTTDIDKNQKIGDILENYDVLDYVTSFHSRDDFDDSDFYERIMEFDHFKYEIVDIEKIDLDSFYVDEEIINEYIKDFKESGTYPPPVLKNDLEIIDGTHRLNALYELGIKKVRCYIGYKE